MKTFTTFAQAAALFAGLTTLITPAFADQWDKKTIVTVDAPVALPTMTLEPGSYTFKLLDSPSNRHIVTVWDKDGMRHLTTVLAIPNYRVKPTGESKFTFWETPAGQPAAMRAWFYPGDNFGQEFAYPKWMADKMTLASNRDPVPTLSTDESRYGAPAPTSSATAETNEIARTETPAVTAAAATTDERPASDNATAAAPETPTPSAVEPEPAPAPEAPASVAAAANESAAADPMPATASSLNEVMLAGLLASMVAIGTFLKIRG